MTQLAKTKAEIMADIRDLAESCLEVAVLADYYGGMDGDLKRVSRVMLGGYASLVALADGVTL